MFLFQGEAAQGESSAKQDNSAQRASEMLLAAGEGFNLSSLSHYRLERELGRGFSSIVYTAHDDRRQRTVALKVLTFLQTLDEERQRDLAERFRREAQAVSTLSHPNIVAIYDVGQGEDGRQFIAMEYLPGETLRRRLNQAAPLSVPETVAIGVRVAEALHYAHGRGIIHRDVKPDNIFLAQNGAATTPKLMDFGIAHVLSDQALTQDGTIVGSPAYMSPEQIHGLPLDARTDIFSLAVTLTEMATGVKPFEAETIPAVMQKILRHGPDLRAVANRHLQRVLAKALAKNPAARYPDAGAFAQALRQAAPFAVPSPSIETQRLAQASLDAVPDRPRRLSRLSAIGLGVAGLGGLAFASLAALPFWAGHPPQASLQGAHGYPKEALPRMASVNPTITAFPLPPHTIRLEDSRAKRQEHTRVPPTVAARPLPSDWGAAAVQIKEVTPTWGVFPAHLGSTRTSRMAPSQPPRSTMLHRPVTAQRLGSDAPKPIIRVADSRQERTPNRLALPTPSISAVPDTPPRPLSRPMPQPVDGLDRTDAVVRLRLSVNEYGEVTNADILDSSGSRALDDTALDAVGQWQYDPAIQDGQPVPGTVLETVKFFAGAGHRERMPSRAALTTSPPRALSRPMPQPVDGLDRTDAVVRLRLSVNEYGEVTNADILDSSGSRALDDTALDAVGQWQYDPAIQDGQPVPGTVLETVKFVPRLTRRRLHRTSWMDQPANY